MRLFKVTSGKDLLNLLSLNRLVSNEKFDLFGIWASY